MKTFITCINGVEETARYAQEMVSDIAHQLGFKHMGIYSYDSSKESDQSLSSRYDGIIAGLSAGDIIFFQYPTWNYFKFTEGLINRMKLYDGRVVVVIHDLEPLMFKNSRFMLDRIIALFNSVEALIVPSYAMKKFLLDNGVRSSMKFVIQEIWDYTTDIQFSQKQIKFQKEIHFAGKPSKFLFPHKWNFDVPLQVYTSEQCRGENAWEMGRMDSRGLLLELAKGGFGLVWYGDDYWREYMKYNNSFKLSTYLAAGIPVIVPRGISNQYLIEKNHLGLVVDRLEEAVEQVKNMDESTYRVYVRNVGNFAPLIRNGYFTKKFLIDAMQMLMRQDMLDYAVPSHIYEKMDANSSSDLSHICIMDMQKTLDYVKDRQISIARFGDGEIDLMTGHSIPYQDYDEELAGRLKKIITMPDNKNLLVCLPDIFERRERYTEACNSFWSDHLRRYRKFYIENVSSKKNYGSAFLSRPYLDLSDKAVSAEHFHNLKEFFTDKSILIVEGKYSRSGVGNDLFYKAKSVERIICPSRNAYKKYEVILDKIRQYGRNKLILLMLGPTAKVLAFDLAMEGYWAVDIGHIDSEYEWYKLGTTKKTKLKNKHTAEFNYDENIELQKDDVYAREVVEILFDE